MVYTDKNVNDSLQHILEQSNARSVLLVTGKQSFRVSGLASMFDELLSGHRVRKISGAGVSPEFDFIADTVNILNNQACDIIIAVGGGSVIDLAKIIALFLYNQQSLHADFTDHSGLKAAAPIVAIPTTAGSGSEATHFAVMYKDGQKHSIASQEILPAFAILDPELTSSLPPFTAACSGMDAVCQAIESLWANNATEESRQDARTALEYLLPNIIASVKQPGAFVRKQMLLGAHYAGRAINVSKTTGPHALSYYLTSKHGIPHGEAVAMNMELFIDMNFEFLCQDSQTFLKEKFGAGEKKELINRFTELKTQLGLRQSISDAGITSENDLKAFFYSVNTERLSNNPGNLNPRQLLNHHKNLFKKEDK